MDGKVTKIEKLSECIFLIEIATFEITENDLALLGNCLNSTDSWRVEIHPPAPVAETVECQFCQVRAILSDTMRKLDEIPEIGADFTTMQCQSCTTR